MLDETLLKEVKDTAISIRAAGGVINRKQILNIKKGVVRANDPNVLREFGGSLNLTDHWTRDVLKQLKWSKCKGSAGIVDPSPPFLAEEKFTFQRTISMAILEHNIPAPLVVNLDQTSQSYVSPEKCTFSFKGAKNVPIKGIDDKRQITVHSVDLQGKTKRSLSKFKFPSMFSLSYTENHWSNTEKSIEFLQQIIFPYLKMVKRENIYPEQQYALIIMPRYQRE